ncbi:high mobility group protein B1-like isoform X2 [Actinia tenebrosa]|uniref:High mobility group protein B1-like isoform X2 n=1 Tax=Actinia tenebrosa TaxID=6105 RepID=A0A6P8H357_ACTTE|nr:high mobility group protein B1-like isoform X2 [Actinia tenebrosa]
MEAAKRKRAAQTNKGRSKKKTKTDDGPKIKRPLSAYLYFTKDFREERAAKGLDNSKVNEVAKCAGERWRSMSEKDKAPYELKAKADKERYQQQSGKGDLPAKDSDKPKRAPTAYFIFLAEFRKKMAGVELEDGQKIPALAGEKWRSMTDKDKEPYAKKEAEEKKKYEAAMESYREKIKDAPKPEKKSKPKKREEPEEEEEDEEDDDDEDDDDDDDDDDDE